MKIYRFISCHGEVNEGVLCVCKTSNPEIIFRGLGSGNPRHTHLYMLRIKYLFVDNIVSLCSFNGYRNKTQES